MRGTLHPRFAEAGGAFAYSDGFRSTAADQLADQLGDELFELADRMFQQEALGKIDKPERKAQMVGWKVFKTDLKGPAEAVTYFVIVDPVIKGNDYNMRTILTEAFGVADTNTIYKQLAESVTGQQIVAMTQTLSMQ